jgi:hypothetical protein
MPLVIENGSLVQDANSYVSVADARLYAEARASTLPEDNAAVEAALFVAMDYLESLRAEYQGAKVSPGVQSLQWPRNGVVIDGWDVPNTFIPSELISAQIQLAIESASGTDLMPTGDGREVIREKVDVLETEWSPGAGGSPQPIFAKVRAFLAPLLQSGGLGRMKVTRG